MSVLNSLVVINTVLHYEFMCGRAKVFCTEHTHRMQARKMRTHKMKWWWGNGESVRETGRERDEDDHSQCVCVLALQLPNDGSNIVQRPIVSINDMMHNFRAHPAAARIPNNKIHAHDSKRLICSPHRCHQQNQTKTIYIKWWPNTIAQIIMNKTRCNRETQPRIRC